MTTDSDRQKALNKLKRKRPTTSSSSRRKTTSRRKTHPRTRPTTRTAARNTARKARPMPKPRTRPRRTASRTTSTAHLSEEMRTQLASINSEFDNLENKAQLADLYEAIGDFDAKLMALPIALEALRGRGYVHGEQLEDRLEAVDDQWDDARPRVEAALEKYVKQLDVEADKVERQVDRGATNQAALDRLQSTISSLDTRIDSANSAISGLYDGLSSELHSVEWDMNKATAMLDLIDGSQEVRLREAEGPLLAVKAEWHRDGGKEGPEGILFLTDQRLMFEQREEVVTKKRFGLFKADSKMIQELQLEIPVQEIEEVTHKEEGGFMGMGKADILEIIFTANAPISRGRFHLIGQDSSDWATMIKLIQTGDIDDDRADEYEEELEETDAVVFPTQCPGCFAPVEPPSRGETSLTCEFCGTVILPE